jgi:hypothetical protein
MLQPEPTRHEAAITLLASVIRDSPDTSCGVQLRRFLWSLYNMHHLVNLWDFATRVPGEFAEPVGTIIKAALDGTLNENDVKRGLLVAGEMDRWDRENGGTEASLQIGEARQILERTLRALPPCDMHTTVSRLLRTFSEIEAASLPPPPEE